MTKKIVTRFAPSPTGYLHIGGVRTALFNFIFSLFTLCVWMFQSVNFFKLFCAYPSINLCRRDTTMA